MHNMKNFYNRCYQGLVIIIAIDSQEFWLSVSREPVGSGFHSVLNLPGTLAQTTLLMLTEATGV